MKPVFYRLAIAALTVACALTGGGTRAGAAGVGLIDASGVMRFPYGPPAPTLTCVPTYACTIILDPGEVVFDKVAGDTVRWIIATGVTGPNGNTPTVYFKPTELGLKTNFIITTNKHTYDIILSSMVKKDETPPLLYGFTYPREEAYSTPTTAKIATVLAAIPTPSPNPRLLVDQMTTIDTSYQISGRAPFTPLHAWNDGAHTYLRMPEHPYTAPTIYVYNDSDGQDEMAIVHQPINNTYIVDGVPSRIILADTAIRPGTCSRNPNTCVVVARVHQ